MRILKEGSLDDRWIGECRECNSVVLANTTEIGTITKINENSSDDFAFSSCPFCKENEGVYYTRYGSSIAKKICRKNNINSVSLKPKG